MIDDATLAAIGAGIMGFGVVAFVFRVQRELEGRERSLTRRELEVWERRAIPPDAAEGGRGTDNGPTGSPGLTACSSAP